MFFLVKKQIAPKLNPLGGIYNAPLRPGANKYAKKSMLNTHMRRQDHICTLMRAKGHRRPSATSTRQQ